MNLYIKLQVLLFKRLGIALALLMLTRVIFYFVNIKYFTELNIGQVLMHLFFGLRFDWAIICLLNLPLVFFSVLPVIVQKYDWYQKALKYLFIVVNIAILIPNIVDFSFFEFEGKRLTADYFSKEWLGHDFFTLLPDFLKDYWFLFLGFFVGVWLFIKFNPVLKYNIKDFKFNTRSFVFQLLFMSVFLGLVIIGGRGGLQLKPIGILTAARYAKPEHLALVLNSPFTIVKTVGRQNLQNPKYYSATEIVDVFNPIHDYKHNEFHKKNVVILILESFGKEYSGFLNDTIGYTPFLDSLMQQGVVCTNAYANGKRSLDALPAILTSLPVLMDNAFITSSYAANTIESLGGILSSNGYNTSFYHGGKTGTMGFNYFTKLAGVSNYYGMEDYPSLEDYDGSWGIFDEAYLQYFANELTKNKTPFFSTIFTLSSHHPYKIPEKYTEKFPKGELVNLESIGYADYALKLFFKTATTKPWFNNTLFILTADHTAQAKGTFYKKNAGKYAVPIVFYAPGDSTMRFDINTPVQHADIFPSVLDYLGYSQPFLSLGSSIFCKNEPRYAISYVNGIYQFIYKDITIHFNGEEVIAAEKLFKNQSESIDLENNILMEVIEAERLLKGIIQQFNTRMSKNKMYVKK
ncbi:MAG: sulfatase-like hydrolase/transferase [Salinivirgaceae bacterium]|nr:sulfatase-like hydrolase/transferase [Salinivirgaceae bacterium]